MPYTTVATNDVLTASHFNTNYRDQVTATVTSGTRPSGTEGQIIYETDTDRYYAYTGSAWTEILKLGALNTWTPTLTQSGAVTKTVVTASYMRQGRMLSCFVYLQVTGAGSANNAVTVSLPVTMEATVTAIGGSGYIVDASSGSPMNPGVVRAASTTTAALLDSTQAAGNVNLGQTGSSFSAALANTDVVSMTFSYLAAS